MNKITLFISIITLITAAACRRNNRDLVQGKIKRETVAFSGKVTGRILKLYVTEGQTVKPGDTLAMLDLPEVTAKIAQAQGVVKAASAQHLLAKNGPTFNQIKELKAKLTSSAELLEFATKSYARARAMFEDSLFSPQAYDEAYAKFKNAKAQFDASAAELNEAEVVGTRYETKVAAAGQQEQASGTLKEIEVAYAERFIIATNFVTIETITLRVGELAEAGYPVFNGYEAKSTWFRFTIPESQIAPFRNGQRLSVDVPYRKKAYDGTIATIKQMPHYADITTAYPDYDMDDAVYEIKVIPDNINETEDLLYNALVTLKLKR